MKRSPFWFAEPDIAIDNSHAFAWELDGILFSHLVEFDSRTLTSDLAPFLVELARADRCPLQNSLFHTLCDTALFFHRLLSKRPVSHPFS